MATRDHIVDKVARAAWEAHYCETWHFGRELCEDCLADGRTDCFELSGGFLPDDNGEWFKSAEAAVAAVENALGIMIGEG